MTGTCYFPDGVRGDTVAQITGRGYPVSEVSERPGVRQHSLCVSKRKFANLKRRHVRNGMLSPAGCSQVSKDAA